MQTYKARPKEVRDRESEQYRCVERGLARAKLHNLTLPHDIATCILVELKGQKIV